jgi:nucleoside-triphosphatase THEP1
LIAVSLSFAGDAEECHPCIGRARRMMVRRHEEQVGVLVQAVQNHNPDVIIVDEIGTKLVRVYTAGKSGLSAVSPFVRMFTNLLMSSLWTIDRPPKVSTICKKEHVAAHS